MQEEMKALYFEKNFEVCKAAENIVTIDPNKRDLLYCQDAQGVKFRYTSNQRMVETGSRQRRKKRERLKQASGIDQVESTIPTHKTMILNNYMLYLRQLQLFSNQRQEFYTNSVHNKWKWKTFMNTQQTEQNLIKNMKKKYGNDFVVVMGIGNSVLEKQDYYKTSSLCPFCDGNVEKNFMNRLSSRHWQRRKGKMEIVHGLLGCNNLQCIKQGWARRYWNRDILSTCNMQKIVKSTIIGTGRPAVLSRRPVRFQRANLLSIFRYSCQMVLKTDVKKHIVQALY
ncbi:hypothetical protein HK099_007505 [Clydaea vesicula]|uniref:Transposase n=1 Tax=Clydaea vesicula TaxID=447962 RepID=A0AAD5TWC8_9FUNG|nr:hypothetical protein HK099_007505 [Clydaea vesicula]